jgi:carbon-monoxide dehydrogenase catalytic subunit
MGENKAKDSRNKTIDPAAAQLIRKAEKDGVSTAFSRVDEMRPCSIGMTGICCKNCYMGPCRLNKPDSRGICGATAATVAARNLTRAIAGGSAAHSNHGRDVAMMLRAVAKGETTGIHISDETKLMNVAADLGIDTEGRSVNEIALAVAEEALANFGRQEGELSLLNRAPAERQQLWKKEGIAPRGVDREIVEAMHRTTMGVDTDPEHILTHSLKTALGDGWGGSMLATDIQDILFGTPWARRGQVNLGVLKEDEVNIITHGHEALLSEMIVAASRDPEMIKLAESKGAKGINVAGICCSSNETLARQGVPPAGNFLHQELAIVTGVADAMVVDVQCIYQSLADVAASYHTKLVATSKKAKITGAEYMVFDEQNPLATAKDIVRLAIENYPNRKNTEIPDYLSDLVAGFSHEYIRYMLGGEYRNTLRPLNDAIMEGRIMGLAGVVGCNNPRVEQDAAHRYIVEELIKNDVLVVQTGCGAIANAKYGLLLPEAMAQAGPGLKEIGEAVGMPPVLHMGSCVDNSRILTILSDVISEGGLGDDISDLPAVGIAPEWMSEKALAIGAYFVASGAYVIFGGVDSPVKGSPEVENLIGDGWQNQVKGRLEFVTDPAEIVRKSLDHIKERRAALGLSEYKPGKYVRVGALKSFNAAPSMLRTPHQSR